MALPCGDRLSAKTVYQITRSLLHCYPSAGSLPLALIDPQQQQLYLVRHFLIEALYSVSTSRYGLGCYQDSWQTPVGAHCVAEKIGAGAPLYSEFVGRRATGATLVPDTAAARERNAICTHENDAICTRIVRLAGMDAALNQGGYCDSYARYIYIHGTTDERRIGQPTSLGCIRMKNEDVIEVFEQLQVGSLVYILM